MHAVLFVYQRAFTPKLIIQRPGRTTKEMKDSLIRVVYLRCRGNCADQAVPFPPISPARYSCALTAHFELDQYATLAALDGVLKRLQCVSRYTNSEWYRDRAHHSLLRRQGRIEIAVRERVIYVKTVGNAAPA